MAKNTKTKGAKGSPVVTAPKPEAAKGKTPIVTMDAPTPEAKAEAKPKATVAGKYLSRDQFDIDGKGSRRVRVAEYQDYTFTINDQPDRRLTDEELCADWHRQFPGAVDFEPFHVKGARRDFNMGRHSKTFHTERHGDAMSQAYVLVNGERVRADQAPKPVKAAPAPKPKGEVPIPVPAPAPKHAVKVKKHHKAA